MALTRAQLDQLLDSADGLIELASSAGEFVRSIRDRTVSASTISYLNDTEDKQTAYFLPPGFSGWPPVLYAFTAVDRLPGAWDRIARLIDLSTQIAELRGSAQDAAPGFLGRLFRGAKVKAAESAAEELSRRLDDPNLHSLAVDVRSYLEQAESARTSQSRGVHLFPGSHGTPDYLITAAQNALEKALKSSLTFITYDPSRLQQVLAAARRLRDDPGSEPALRAEAQRQLDVLAKERSEILLRQLPVEALRSATNERLRFTGLDTVRVSTVDDVLKAPTGLLTQVNGIGESTARRLKAAAETLRQETMTSHATGIGDTPTRAATALVTVLARFDQVNFLDEFERERRRRILKYADHIPTVTGGDPWTIALTGGEHGTVGWTRFVDDIAWASIHPQLLAPARASNPGDGAWADYLARPAHYQGLLATLLDLEVEGGEDLNADILEQIRSLRLDHTHLTGLHLRGYQSFGARFALVQKKVILGDEMGLGKTIQALSAAAHLAAQGQKHTLVICPASVITNWVRESRRFTNLPVYKAHGIEKGDAVTAWAGTGGVCVVTFAGARSMDLLAAAVPDLVVVDEAHMIKNPVAGRTKAARKIIEESDHALLMTGTPLENRVAEFATLISFVAPDLLGAGMQSLNAEDFRLRIAPAYLRRNQVDVLDELPEKLEQIDWINLTVSDEKHYSQAVEEASFMGMRRASMTTPHTTPAKVERILEIVEEAAESNRKVLIFTYFLDALRVLEHALGDRVIGTVSGSVSPDKRQELIDALDTAPGGCVLLAQITAGGAGLNIQSASVVILCEPQVKPSIEAQAIARVHRMGQTSTVVVHRLIAENTVDERMVEMLAGKEQIFDAYARPSETAAVHDSVDVTEMQLVTEIIAAERKRLSFTGIN